MYVSIWVYIKCPKWCSSHLFSKKHLLEPSSDHLSPPVKSWWFSDKNSKTPRWELTWLFVLWLIDWLSSRILHTSKLRCIFGESYIFILMVFMSLVFGGSPEVKKLCIVNQGWRGRGLKRPCSASDRGSLTRGMQMFQKGMGMPSWCAWNKVKICAFFAASPWLAIKKRKEWLNDWSVILLSSHFSFSYVRTIPSWRDLPRCFKSADQSSTQLLKSGFRICLSTEDDHQPI